MNRQPGGEDPERKKKEGAGGRCRTGQDRARQDRT